LETPAKLGKITYEQFAKWQKALSLFSLAVTLVNTLFDLAKSIYTSVAQGKLQSELVVLFESW
jgi:hypothetical protein